MTVAVCESGFNMILCFDVIALLFSSLSSHFARLAVHATFTGGGECIRWSSCACAAAAAAAAAGCCADCCCADNDSFNSNAVARKLCAGCINRSSHDAPMASRKCNTKSSTKPSGNGEDDRGSDDAIARGAADADGGNADDDNVLFDDAANGSEWE